MPYLFQKSISEAKQSQIFISCSLDIRSSAKLKMSRKLSSGQNRELVSNQRENMPKRSSLKSRNDVLLGPKPVNEVNSERISPSGRKGGEDVSENRNVGAIGRARQSQSTFDEEMNSGLVRETLQILAELKPADLHEDIEDKIRKRCDILINKVLENKGVIKKIVGIKIPESLEIIEDGSINVKVLVSVLMLSPPKLNQKVICKISLVTDEEIFGSYFDYEIFIRIPEGKANKKLEIGAMCKVVIVSTFFKDRKIYLVGQKV